MQYNRLNGIVQKALQYTLNGQNKGYTLDYKYDNKKHPHAPSIIAESGKPKARQYQYDGNGNPTYYDEFKGFRSMVWDEENRLRGINDNGRLHLYTYDHTGERALKSSAESSMAVINGLASAVITHTEDYTAYVSPYFVVQKGKFTKHYFEGSSRIVSKLGEGTFSHKNTGIMAGGLDYLTRSKKEEEVRQSYIKGLQVPPGPLTQHGIYATPEWTKQPYPSIDWEAISQNQEPPAGWPRYPRFNEPGDVPGPPVQFGPPVTNANVKAGYGFIPNGVEEKNLYYYHPDHLGSSSYITDREGQIIQHTEYIAFGETFVDEHSTTNKMQYLFNGKELDYETGLYYYGARYYDPKVSLWLNTDPLMEKYPEVSPYTYTLNNPIMLIDPDGRDIVPWLINSFKNGNTNRPRMTRGYMSTNLKNALSEFGKTTQGAQFFRQFLKKGQSFLGVKATQDGIYSDQTLNIVDMNMLFADKFEKAYATGAGNGTPWNGLTLLVPKNDNNLDMNIYMDSSDDRSEALLVEVFSHEALVHGDKYGKELNDLSVLGKEAYSKTRKHSEKDHIALRDKDTKHSGYRKYEQTKNELIKRNTRKYKPMFDAAEREYKDKYKNYK